MRLEHQDAMRVHALRRFFERTGTVLAAEEYERMCEAIRRDQLPPAAMTSHNLRFYKVRVRGVTAFALWKANTIVTFYPSEDWVIQRGGRILSWEGRHMRNWLIHTKKLKRKAHIWTGYDTACRMAMTGGLKLSGYVVVADKGDRVVCHMCSNARPVEKST